MRRLLFFLIIFVVIFSVLSKKKKKKSRRKKKRKFSVDPDDTPQYSHDQIHLITCTTCHCLVRKVVRLRRNVPPGSPFGPFICSYVHGPDKYKDACEIFLYEYGDWIQNRIKKGISAYTICNQLGACTDEILNVEVSGGRADQMIGGSNVDKIFGAQCKVDNQLIIDFYEFFHSVCWNNPRCSREYKGKVEKEVESDLPPEILENIRRAEEEEKRLLKELEKNENDENEGQDMINLEDLDLVGNEL